MASAVADLALVGVLAAVETASTALGTFSKAESDAVAQMQSCTSHQRNRMPAAGHHLVNQSQRGY